MRDVVELPQGYTLAEVEKMARAAAVSLRTRTGDSMADLVDDAWSAIVERLYADPEPIAAAQLVWVGRSALYRAAASRLSQNGCFDRDISNGLASGPRFRAYWYMPTTTIEHQVVERQTLAQVWTQLTDRDREVFVAFAIYDDYQTAAEAIGVSHGNFRYYIIQARKRFLRLWHEGETPTKIWGFNHPGNGGLGKYRRKAS